MRADRYVKPLALVACVALVGFIAFAVVSASSHPARSFPAVPPASRLAHGEAAPAFRASRLGGGAEVSFTGRSPLPTVVNFFASWCTDCVAELDAFGAVSRHTPGTRFIGVDSDDPNQKAAEQLLRRAGISYSVGVDGSGAIANRYLVAALPVTFFISASGSVESALFGAASASELRAGIARLHGGHG
ncbi:MAG: TlpA family protein disulfide reductase [Nitrososphaerales archaeon]